MPFKIPTKTTFKDSLFTKSPNPTSFSLLHQQSSWLTVVDLSSVPGCPSSLARLSYFPQPPSSLFVSIYPPLCNTSTANALGHRAFLLLSVVTASSTLGCQSTITPPRWHDTNTDCGQSCVFIKSTCHAPTGYERWEIELIKSMPKISSLLPKSRVMTLLY